MSLPACAPTAASSLARWRNTRTAISSVTSAAPRASSSHWPSSSAEGCSISHFSLAAAAVIAMLSSILAFFCPPVGPADQLVDVLAAWSGVDDRCAGLPAVHGMGHEHVELAEVNAWAMVGEFGGWIAELSLKLIAS